MALTEPPLRRAYGRDLALGVPLVLASLVVLLIRVPRTPEPGVAAITPAPEREPRSELAAVDSARERR
jgi:hypothetical protein